MTDEIVNKVASSGLITIDLEELYPAGDRRAIDIAEQLWQGIALREKEFRDWIKGNDWEQYRNCHVAVFCSADAIIPNWAFMLVTSALTGIASTIVLGSKAQLESVVFRDMIMNLDIESYRDARVVIKGCSDREVPASAYSDLVVRIQPVAKSVMFGEPCSTVPVFKKPVQKL